MTLRTIRHGENPLSVVVAAVLGLVFGLIWYVLTALLAQQLVDTPVAVALLGLLDVVVVLAAVRSFGIITAIPLGVASVVAIDWHLIPPTHDSIAPTIGNALALSAYLVGAALLGCLANAVSRRATVAERGRRLLAEEQLALRRVATLVARETRPDEVFTAVTAEMRDLLGVEIATLVRYESSNVGVVVAWAGPDDVTPPMGAAIPLDTGNVVGAVHRSHRPARVDDYRSNPGALPGWAVALGVTASAGCPVTVGGRVWGIMIASSTSDRPLPPGAEARIDEFTELISLAIGNAQTRIDLQASRARVVTRADEARKLLERDLHDGIQQRLVALALEVRLTESAPEPAELRAGLQRIGADVVAVIDEVRELSHGLHPAILSSGGLRPALSGLARRSRLPVEVHYRGTATPPEPVQVAAYYVVAEALTNVVKHAQASYAAVEVDVRDDEIAVVVRDDGVGGADFNRGSGMVGLRDRVEALGGGLDLVSRAGSGTTLTVRLPYAVAALTTIG